MAPDPSPAGADPLSCQRPERARAHAALAAIAFLALTALSPLFSACTDGPPKLVIDNLDPEHTPSMSTRRVETLISDSGITRYRITAPLWLVFDEAATPHWRFPKGLRLDKYNTLFQQEATVTADSAYYDKNRQLWRLDGNVNIENAQKELFLTNQLFWDQRTHKVYSDSFIHIERADRTIEGYGFTANEAMTSYRIRSVQGIFPASQFTPGSRSEAAPADTASQQ